MAKNWQKKHYGERLILCRWRGSSESVVANGLRYGLKTHRGEFFAGVFDLFSESLHRLQEGSVAHECEHGSCSLTYQFGALAGCLHERELQRRLRERQIRWREFEEE